MNNLTEWYEKIMYNELEGTGIKPYQILSWHLPGGTEENRI
jgi:hypothetical protein